jgi:hypothetical protein
MVWVTRVVAIATALATGRAPKSTRQKLIKSRLPSAPIWRTRASGNGGRRAIALASGIEHLRIGRALA